MTKTAQVSIPKMCHERFAPRAKIDRTGRATSEVQSLSVAVGSLYISCTATHKGPNKRDPGNPFSRSSCDPNRIHNHT